MKLTLQNNVVTKYEVRQI